MTHYCQPCDYHSESKYNYDRHLASTKHLKLVKACAPDEKEKIIEKLNLTVMRQAMTIQNLTEQRDQFKALVEQAMIKPTTVVNNNAPQTTTNTTNTTNNNLMLSAEPIRYSTLKEETSKHITAEIILEGDKKYAETILSNFLQDKEGKNKVVCTDLSRQNFQYKDEDTGKLVSDPQLTRFKKAVSECVYKNSELKEDLYEATRLETKDREPDAEIAMNYLKRAALNGKVIKHIAKRTYKRAVLQFED